SRFVFNCVDRFVFTPSFECSVNCSEINSRTYFVMYSRLRTGDITKSTIIVMPLVHKYVDGETAHNLAVRAASWGLIPRFGPNRREYDELACEFLGMQLKNPIGLAAGFDKNAEAVGPLSEVSGFGLVEVGSVTPIPQEGNAKPRMFRLLEDEGIINRYGFNSDGANKVSKRVKAAKARRSANAAPVGVNLGKNKFAEDPKVDYEVGVNHFAPICDYLVVNVSSPNTPGLRSMQKRADLQSLLAHVKYIVDANRLEKRPKVLLKIAPDLELSEKKDIAQVVLDRKYGVDGLIVSNTTISRPETLKSEFKNEAGGLSGAPIRKLSTDCIKEMYSLTQGRIPIVGCGGVSSGEDAYEKIRAGASVVQLYSALTFQGFPVIGKVKRELVELLRRDGFKSVTEAVGADHRKHS
ncbi:dihydroorotate oxidase, partial [Cooperia oncophora]